MKKFIYILVSALILFTFSSCSQKSNDFTITENGNLISASGTEYTHFANEGDIYYFGELVFQGAVSGEAKTSEHLGVTYQTGLFSIKNQNPDSILVRYWPNNEWGSIYRNATLPSFDISVDNCVRLELVLGIGNSIKDSIHTTCTDGIRGKTDIGEFLSDIRSQKSAKDAGLYDLVKKSDGMFDNCYTYGVIYGFFENEPNLAVRMDVISFNDLAYSIKIKDNEYVLPEIWLERLQMDND